MPFAFEPSRLTGGMKDHEKLALAALHASLDEAGEEGSLFGGRFELRIDGLPKGKGSEVDGIVVLSDLILLLELKSMQNARYVHVKGFNETIDFYFNRDDEPPRFASVDEQVGRIDRYVRPAVVNRVGEFAREDVRSGDVRFHTVLVAYAGLRQVNAITKRVVPIGFRFGQEHGGPVPYGEWEGMYACTPTSMRNLVALIRRKQGMRPVYPLDSRAEMRLAKLREVVDNKIDKAEVDASPSIDDVDFDESTRIDDGDVEIFKGRDVNSGEPLWVKKYRKNVLAVDQSKVLQDRLVARDRDALATFPPHHNIVAYRRYRDIEESLYVFLHRDEGRFLSDYVASGISIPDMLPERLTILSGILDGLAHIHQQRVGGETGLYRDLRPESVFVTVDGVAQLFNFDSSRLPSAAQTKLARVQRKVQQPGWRRYASPELLEARYAGQVDARTDVYSWGIVAYELLAGRLPYEDLDAAEDGDFTPLARDAALSPVAQRLRDLIDRAIAPDRSRRPTIADLRDAVREALLPFSRPSSGIAR